MERELKVKSEQKKKKPKFARQEAHVRQRLGTSWRRPRGIHSKMRQKRAGKHAQVRIGYRTIRAARGLGRFGLHEIVVSNVNQLANINKDTHIAVFASTVGLRKKQVMLKKAIELGIKIANIKNAQKELEKIEANFKKRKEDKKAKAEKKKEKPKKAEKKPEEKKIEPKEEPKPVETPEVKE